MVASGPNPDEEDVQGTWSLRRCPCRHYQFRAGMADASVMSSAES